MKKRRVRIISCWETYGSIRLPSYILADRGQGQAGTIEALQRHLARRGLASYIGTSGWDRFGDQYRAQYHVTAGRRLKSGGMIPTVEFWLNTDELMPRTHYCPVISRIVSTVYN